MHASPQQMVASTEAADTHIRHLYIHVPFCEGACSYCAFYKEPFTACAIPSWLKACEHEIRQAVRTHSFSIETLYMGGGTPSLLEPAQFQELQQMLKRHFNLDQCREWTIEANPESVSEPKSAAWQQAGVTRMSLGVQSLQPTILRNMNRRHDVATIHHAVDIIQAHADWSMGIDLIAGYPGVTEKAWLDTLTGVLAFDPDHLSVYECTRYPGSRLSRDITNGEQQEMPPRARDRALRRVSQRCKAAGYEHYETSNYSKPGKRCRHNLAVWRGEDYLGLGPGASSRVGRYRWTNKPNLAAYAKAADDNQIPRHTEQRTPEQDATERLMFAFRLRDPVHLDDFMPADASLAQRLRLHWNAQLQALREAGLVRKQGDNWYTSTKGQKAVDHIAEALLL